MIYLLPALISLSLGWLILKAVLKNRLPGPLLSLFLSATIGLGSSGLLTFASFALFNQLVAWFVILLNISIAGILAAIVHRRGKTIRDTHFSAEKCVSLIVFPVLLTLAFVTLGMFIFASLYPYGGWDAWGCWNFKARFLFLAGDTWTNMFDPVLWRNQILYPFLLPLIHVWFWSFGNTPTYAVPMAMTCAIPLVTAGLLYSALKEFTGKWYMILVPLWIFTNMFTIQLSASQYSDLLVGLFILTATTLFLLFQKDQEPGYLFLMGLVLGMLGFTKVEGEALCLIILITTLALILTNTAWKPVRKKAILALTAATALAAIPLIIFLLIHVPHDSGIFINGITSAEKPTSLARLMTIITYYGREFISVKWTGLWIALAAILMISGKRSLHRNLWIMPIILGTYFLIFTGSYVVNTFYEITWWLDTSLNRIIFALIPVTALWAFLSIEE